MSRQLSFLQATILGIALAGGLTLGGYGLFVIQSRNGGDVVLVTAKFQDVAGIRTGSRVQLQGVDIGEVVAVRLPERDGERVAVDMQLQGAMRARLGIDAKVEIVRDHPLGDKVARITPGSADAPRVTDGDTLAGLESPELLATLQQTAVKLDRLLTRTETAAGTIAGDLAQATARLNRVLEAIDKGEGTLGKLVKDDSLYRNLNTAVGDLQSTVSELRTSNGTIGKLVKDTEMYDDVKKMVHSVKQNADAIKAMPVIRNYVTDAHKIMVRPDRNRERKVLAAAELFKGGAAVLTQEGKLKVDEVGLWLKENKVAGSDVVVAAVAASGQDADFAQTLTDRQSQAVHDYLRAYHHIHSVGRWPWSTRPTRAVGCGLYPPSQPENESLPAARIEVLLFTP